MYIKKITVKNFRLLANVEMALEGHVKNEGSEQATLIVGRNNCGKTSLSEVVRRFLGEQSPKFQIEDFSNASYDHFCEAFIAKNKGKKDEEVREIIPCIELQLLFEYDPDKSALGALSDFVVDLNPDCYETRVVARYALRDGGIESLFAGISDDEMSEEARPAFFQRLRERIPALYTTRIWAEDPNDGTNRKEVPLTSLRSLLKTGFINAGRGLEDDTAKAADVLGKILEDLFTAARLPTADQKERGIADELQVAVQGIQRDLDQDFKEQLKALMPTLKSFGYPGLDSSELETETSLNVERLLSQHTKVRYPGRYGVHLPESYNGLGTRNLVFILLRIISYYRDFCAEENAPGVHLIFIEEPEAHLHPQMQEVFIRKISEIAAQLSREKDPPRPWPVQFIVSTHSSHIANEAGFEAIRYFLPRAFNGSRQTVIKDLRNGLDRVSVEDRKFLQRYLTLTRCDLFFADKAVLIEGTSERLLLPVIIDKLEKQSPEIPKLSTQYITTIEVGGAYAHIFFGLLEFLELRALVITDIDTVIAANKEACMVHKGKAISNACLKKWFDNKDISPAELLQKEDADKIKGFTRIAYQRPEEENGPCGRTFEDAFVLANLYKFNIKGVTREEKATSAWDEVANVKKSSFALKYAIKETDWTVPGYILDGLKWLATEGSLDEDCTES